MKNWINKKTKQKKFQKKLNKMKLRIKIGVIKLCKIKKKKKKKIINQQRSQVVKNKKWDKMIKLKKSKTSTQCQNRIKK